MKLWKKATIGVLNVALVAGGIYTVGLLGGSDIAKNIIPSDPLGEIMHMLQKADSSKSSQLKADFFGVDEKGKPLSKENANTLTPYTIAEADKQKYASWLNCIDSAPETKAEGFVYAKVDMNPKGTIADEARAKGITILGDTKEPTLEYLVFLREKLGEPFISAVSNDNLHWECKFKTTNGTECACAERPKDGNGRDACKTEEIAEYYYDFHTTPNKEPLWWCYLKEESDLFKQFLLPDTVRYAWKEGNDQDTDGDGVPDNIEKDQNSDPNDKKSYLDTDKDGVPDYIENKQGTAKDNGNDYLDTDKDLVPDYIESYFDRSVLNDPLSFLDTDKDLVPDYVEERDEINKHYDGLGQIVIYKDRDTDKGGVSDYIERVYYIHVGLTQSDPNDPSDDNRDSDGGGESDISEIRYNKDPKDPSDDTKKKGCNTDDPNTLLDRSCILEQ